MCSASKHMLRGVKYLALSLLMVAVGMPVVTLSQEGTAEPAPVVEDVANATTTPPIATTTAEFLAPGIDQKPEETMIKRGEVLGESIESESTSAETTAGRLEEDVEEDIEEEGLFDQTAAAILSLPTPQLSMRKFKKRVIVDSRAFHSCEADVFRIDISGKSSARAGIMLERDSDVPYEIEIGGLPQGIDISFSKNRAYRYMQGANERFLELIITNQAGSQRGNFSIPVIYTRKDAKESSVVCQINIVNV